MFDWLKKQHSHLPPEKFEQVKDYVMLHYRKPIDASTQGKDSGIKYSRRTTPEMQEREDQLLDIPLDLAEFMVGEQTPDLEFWPIIPPKIGATFVQVLAKLINESGMTGAQIYKKAQIDRRLYSKILSSLHLNPKYHYIPAKDTIISLSMAMELSLGKTNALLYKAGYSFSTGIQRDLIIEYFLRNHIYNIDTLNDTLFRMGEKTLGRKL